ncbi:MAG: alpha/beta fold hydrolase [Novosphingobium sp.]|nr:alpha/beta fold hydrolase [Novosphingobium sp.]
MTIFEGQIGPGKSIKSLTLGQQSVADGVGIDPGGTITVQHFGKRKLRTCLWNAERLQGSSGGRGKSAHGDNPLPLLIFNGIGLNLEVLGPLAADLADRPVLSIDMPGIGHSPPSKVPYTPQMAAKWGAQLLERHNIERADVLGSSWGGAVAQHFASSHRDQLGRLVLAAIGPSLPILPGKATFSVNIMDSIWQGDLARSDLLRQVNEADQRAVIDEVQSLFIPPTKRGYSLQALSLLAWNSVFSIPFLDCETLILAGRQDQIVPLANQQLLHLLLRRAQLDVIEDAGHLFMFSHRNEVAQRLRDFLGSGKVKSEKMR